VTMLDGRATRSPQNNPNEGRRHASPPAILKQWKSSGRSERLAAITLVALLALIIVVHAVNRTRSPGFVDDEGTYVSQAWAFQTEGHLSHYTYWYDHPPLGWIQLAIYTSLTDGFGRGPAVAAAREFLLAYAAISAALVYVLARRLRIRRPASLLSVALFSLTPLAIEFQRLVMLDNLAMPWVLGAFVLALSPRRRLMAHAAGAACFAVAVLTKETSVLLLPSLVWIYWTHSRGGNRRYSLILSAMTFGLMVAIYPLYAVLKNELFPGSHHVSLLSALGFQLFTRRSGGSVFQHTSIAQFYIRSWLSVDFWTPVLILVSAALGWLVRPLRPFALALAILFLMTVRGGYVPYALIVVPLPFAAIIFGGITDRVFDLVAGRRSAARATTAGPRTRRRTVVATAATLLMLVGIFSVPAREWEAGDRKALTANDNSSLGQAEAWIYQSLPRSSTYLVDNVFWIDMVLHGYPQANVVWMWKIDSDPAVQKLFPHGWQDFDYVISTVYVRGDVQVLPQVGAAVEHSKVVASFGQGAGLVEIRKVLQPSPANKSLAVFARVGS
jgi:hypothetical protein